MAIEIERKFLVRDERWRTQADAGVFYSQGYLSSDPKRCIRVRLAGERAWLNIKSALSSLRRLEYEYEIPLADARELLHNACPEPPVEKTRYHVEYQGHVWEVDVFEGANAGLVVAELELDSEQQAFARPPWLGDEVSDDARYYNMNLASLPYSKW
jgi:adenylate cyclase